MSLHITFMYVLNKFTNSTKLRSSLISCVVFTDNTSRWCPVSPRLQSLLLIINIVHMIKRDKYSYSIFSIKIIYLPMNISAMSSSSSQSWGRTTYTMVQFLKSLNLKRTHILVLIIHQQRLTPTFIRPLLLVTVILYYPVILKKVPGHQLQGK